MTRIFRFFWRYGGFFVAAAVFALVIARQFTPALLMSGTFTTNWRLWILVALVLFILFRLGSFARSRSMGKDRATGRDFLDDFDTTFLILAATNLLIQISGEFEVYFYPLNYLFMAMFVIFLGVKYALFYAVFIPLLEVPALFVAGRPFLEILAQSLLHAAVGLTFVGVIGIFILTERRDRDRAVDKLNRLTGDAKDLFSESGSAAPAVLRDKTNAQDVHHTRELDEELAGLVDIARNGLGADACVALFPDRYGALLRVRAMSGDSPDLDEDAMVPIEGTIYGLVLQNGEPLNIKRIDRRRVHLEYRKRAARIRSCLLHPIFNGDGAAGVLVADSLREGAFDKAAEEFFGKIAAHVEAAFRAAKGVAEIDRERSEFAAYYEVVKKFSTTLTVDNVLEIIFEAGRTILPFDAALVSVSDPERGTGTIAAVAGLPEKWIGLSFEEEKSLAGWVTRTKQYLSYKKSDELSGVLYHPDCKFKGMESYLVVPLQFRGRVYGTLGFFWTREDAVSSYDLKLLETVAIHAAASLDSARMYDEMEQLATTDGLTALPNHRTFQLRLDHEFARYKRVKNPLTLILCDIDHFKKINDEYGHPVGDLVLKRVAAVMAQTVRDIDTAARYGGEEFAIILPNTSSSGAWKFADRLRKQIGKQEVEHPGGKVSVTISLGLATFPDDAGTKAALIKAADQALYFSKETGRNRVSRFTDVPPGDQPYQS